ncbi:MAG: ABC transporter ATP-binding protein [Mesorhizobium sp.]|nr:MAG: ABC transporter ATP-binding protein [Mesorhizobium sp.]
MLEVEELDVRYGKVPAVRSLSFNVDTGEIVCLVGPNGAGKSTTTLAIAGVLKPAAGDIRFNGRSIAGRPPETIAAAGISLVPEGRHVFAGLSVKENLGVAARLRRGSGQGNVLLDKVLAVFPILRERYNGAAGALSGGEQQQLVIARAMLTQPTLMIVDEPSLGLAPRFVELVMSTFRQLREDGQTLLIVEQSTRRALSLADRVHLLRSGRCIMQGTASDLAADPTFEAAYFGGREA